MKETKKINRLSAEDWAAARALWEADPTMTYEALGERIGQTRSTVYKYAKRNGWEKLTNSADLAKKASAAADRVAVSAREVAAEDGNGNIDGNAETSGGNEPPAKKPPTAAERKAAVQPSSEEVQQAAVAMRAEIIERHRKEWSVSRGLVGEAVKQRDFERAKLAKITSETIKIIQEGERKAWGLDAADPADKPVVIIERSSAGG